MCKKISVQKKNPLWGALNCGGPGAAAPFAPLLIRHWILVVASPDIIWRLSTKLGEIMYRTSLVTRSENVPPDDRVMARHDYS